MNIPATPHEKTFLRRLSLVSVLSVIGFGANAYLSALYYQLRAGTAGFKSLCNVSQTVNCDVVALSPYAELFSGFPLSSFAAGAFVALFALSILGRNENWRKLSSQLIQLYAGIGVIFSIVYFVIMATKIQSWCLFCLITDVVCIGTFAVSFSLRKLSNELTPAPSPTPLHNGIGLSVAAVLVGIVILKGFDQKDLSDSEVHTLAARTLNSPPVAVTIPKSALKIGPDNAPITVVEFSDFQCPHCRIGAQALHAVLGQHPGKVQLIVKAFPLDRKCNRKIESEMHAFACEAAGTVRCAQEQGKFKEIYEALFENQELLESKGPRAIAIEHGLDAAQLDTCLKNPATQQILTQEIEEGIQLGVAATPTYFVNGHKMEGPNPLAVWNKVIEVLRAP